MLPGLTEGRIVHYVLAERDLPETHKRDAGTCVPAIVVNCWRSLNRDDGYSNLQVFVDGTNHGVPSGMIWATSRTYSEGNEPGTWHWPERT